MHIQHPPFNTPDLRGVLGRFATGVTVITTLDAHHEPHGLTVNSFASVSLDPPLVLWSQSKRAASHPTFFAAREFAVSILAEDHGDVATGFARPRPDKFAGVPVNSAFCGHPVIEGSCAWLHCRTSARIDGGDHTIYIAEVLKTATGSARPLVFSAGAFLPSQSLALS